MSLKLVKKLAEKKHREETGLFLVEGEKNIRELLASNFYVETIFGTTPFLDSIAPLIHTYEGRIGTRVEITEVKQEELERAGTLVSNSAGIAVVEQKEDPALDAILQSAEKKLVLALDDVRDPGNLGTIIRTADWFGVTAIVASETTVDFYNPKVISATMGSFTRVSILYTNLSEFLKKARERDIPLIVADMTGENIHTATPPQNGILLMGSESHGVGEDALALATSRVTIPRFGKAESLNVGVATGILLDALKRN